MYKNFKSWIRDSSALYSQLPLSIVRALIHLVRDPSSWKCQIEEIIFRFFPALLPHARRLHHALRVQPYAVREGMSVDSNEYLVLLEQHIAWQNAQEPVAKSANCHLLLFTHSLSSGGAERQWCYLAIELARRGYAVTMLLERLQGEGRHYLPLLEGSSVRVVSMDTLRFPPEMALSIKESAVPYPVYQCLLAFSLLRPSHVLGQLEGGNLWGGAAAVLSPCPIERMLMSFRNVNPSHFPHFCLPWMLPNYQKLIASRRIVLSGNSRFGNDDYALWMGADPANVVCTYNAIELPEDDPSARQDVRAALNIPESAHLVLGVFRLAPEKNPSLFVKVGMRLRKRYPELRMLHAGVGPCRADLERQVSDLGCKDVVQFLGVRQDITKLMQAADILLLTSDFEGLPNVVLEAQAVKLPVVATSVGGVSEAVIEGETALLAKKGDVGSIVKHCERLLSDAGLRQRMGERGRDFIAKHFSATSLGDRVLEAVGLPAMPDRQSSHIPEVLPVAGISASEVYVATLFASYWGEIGAPVVLFVKECEWTAQLPLPPRTLRVCSCKLEPLSDRNSVETVVHVDWQSSEGWVPLQGHVPNGAVAIFFDEVPLWDSFKQAAKKLGFASYVFMRDGTLYHMPSNFSKFRLLIHGIIWLLCKKRMQLK